MSLVLHSRNCSYILLVTSVISYLSCFGAHRWELETWCAFVVLRFPVLGDEVYRKSNSYAIGARRLTSRLYGDVLVFQCTCVLYA